MERYARLLSELTARRRANVYFANPQSIFHGVQVSYVNVGTGNLTFARRDIVAPGRVPIILARVYDSSAIEKADFGQGWMLSAAERIIVDGQAARLIDETGSELEFVIQGDELVLKRDFPTDYTRLFKSDAAITATLRDGSTKIYSPIEGQYRLTSFTDRNGNQLGIQYKGGSVTRLENATHSIDLVRNDRGLIVAAVDEAKRKVVYEYDREGRLITVRDLGDGVWRYDYDGKGLLKAAYDPAGRSSFRATYSDNRVSKLQSPSGTIQYQYEPGQNLTAVVDRKLLRSRYFQNDEGVTTRVVNALGEESRIELDAANNAVSLFRNGSLTDSMTYDAQHRLIQRASIASTGPATRSYTYDLRTGLLASIQSGDQQRAFQYDARGNLLEATNPEGTSHFGFSPSGDLRTYTDIAASLTLEANQDGLFASMAEQGGLATRFTYSPSGQLATIQFSDGKKATFEYGANGLRKLLHYADGREVRYSYDPAGNLVSTAVFDNKGKQVNGQTFVLDDSYAITKRTLFSGKTYVFEYDRNGNLTTMTEDGAVTSFTYDSLDRLIAVKTPNGENYTYTYEPGEHSIIDEYAHASTTPSERIMGGISFNSLLDTYATRQQNSGYGALRYSEPLGAFEFPDEHYNDVVTPDLRVEKALLGMRLLSEGAATPLAQRQGEFTAPINKLYMPAEYATINCCPECYGGPGHWICPDCDPPPPPDPVPAISSITPSRGLVGAVTRVTIDGSSFGTTPTVQVGGAGITITYVSRNDTQIVADFSITPSAAGGNRTVTVTGPGGTSPAVNFFVQIPSRFVFFDQPPEAPGGLGPVVSVVDGSVLNLTGSIVQGLTHQCGVYRNLLFAIADQGGVEIRNGTVTVTEVFSNIANPPGPTPATFVVDLSHEGVNDTQYYGFTYPTCLAANQNQALDMSWSLKVGSGTTTYSASTLVHITKGSFNGTLSVTATITVP